MHSPNFATEPKRFLLGTDGYIFPTALWSEDKKEGTRNNKQTNCVCVCASVRETAPRASARNVYPLGTVAYGAQLLWNPDHIWHLIGISGTTTFEC